ncbi:MAG: hypothetical protein PUB96_04465 [Helicobacteraceae bacterium]|nr:hypothetical protein [Helicobacteraceae bacterium]
MQRSIIDIWTLKVKIKRLKCINIYLNIYLIVGLELNRQVLFFRFLDSVSGMRKADGSFKVKILKFSVES